MSDLIPFSFDSKEIRVIEDERGEALFVAKDVAEVLGYTWKGPGENLSHVPEEWKGYRSIGTPGGTQQMAVITEQGLYFFVNRSDKPKALPFQKWVAGDVIPSIRKHGRYAVTNQAEQGPTLPELMIAEAAARMLRMSDTSKLRMLTGICDLHGISSAFLPSYVDEPLVSAPTALLKKLGESMSARAFNLALIDMGILEELERAGSKGQVKRFKSLTDEGLKYGRNETSPQNPRETQPQYFVDRFPALLDLVHAHLSQEELA